MVSARRVSKALFPGRTDADTHHRGSVVKSNGDGTYQVRLNFSSVSTRCQSLCQVSVGDPVLVLRMRNGSTTILGKYM